jgi:hypothetical protein
MLIRRNQNAPRNGAKRLKLVVPALLCLAPLTMAPVGAATAADDDDQEDCYNLDDECIPFSDITENTKVFLARAADGSTQGFTQWTEYEDHVEDETGLDIDLEDGNVVVVDDDDDPDDPDGIRTAPGVGKVGHLPSAAGGIGQFFARDDFTSHALFDVAPDFVPDLSKLRFNNHSSWNNRISSVRTHGAVALLCLKKNCAATGPIVFVTVPAGTDAQLLGGLNNSVSAIGVF